MVCRCPVPTAERLAPPGPCMSTTRRPARWRLKVRDVSSSICAHAASEIGASSRCRLFIWDVSFQGTDTQRAVVLARGLRGFGVWLGRSRAPQAALRLRCPGMSSEGTKNKFPVTARLKSSSRS